MTDAGQVPARVAANIARRHAANNASRCLYECRAAALLYAGGRFCQDHAPRPGNPTPDPTRTLGGLREAAGIRSDATFLPSHTVLDQRAIDSGRRVSGTRRRAAS